jgi:hypothetical protein
LGYRAVGGAHDQRKGSLRPRLRAPDGYAEIVGNRTNLKTLARAQLAITKWDTNWDATYSSLYNSIITVS